MSTDVKYNLRFYPAVNYIENGKEETAFVKEPINTFEGACLMLSLWKHKYNLELTKAWIDIFGRGQKNRFPVAIDTIPKYSLTLED